VLSYGQEADAILVTARRTVDAASGDQVLVLLRKGDYRLENVGSWDAMGMRGTCSPSAVLISEAALSQIIAEPFRLIASETMVPFSHVVWAACWLGIAQSAVSRARARLQRELKQARGANSHMGEVLAVTMSELQALESLVRNEADKYDGLIVEPMGSAVLRSSRFAFRTNGLKLCASRLAVKICLSCLEICGMAGYLENSEYSMSRHLRDCLSGLLMISNQRLIATNSKLLELPEDPLGK
jgi:acyl-CoA dehydrogenase